MSTAPWLRLDCGWLTSARVMAVGEFAVYWPVILTLLKLHGGSLSDVALTDFAIKAAVRIQAPVKPATTAIRDAFEEAGLLVRDERGEWVTPGWQTYQPDQRPPGRTRAATASQDVPGTPSARWDTQDVPALDGYRTGQDRTEQDNIQVSVVDPPPARAREAAAEPPMVSGETIELFRQSQGGRNAITVPPLVIHQLAVLCGEHGEDKVRAAITRASSAAAGFPTVDKLRDLLTGKWRPGERGKSVPSPRPVEFKPRGGA